MTKPARQRAYGQNFPLIDVMPFPVFATRAPTASDVEFEIGQIWVYNSGSTRPVYIFGGLDSSQDAIWSLASPGASDLDTLTGDGGGAISPSSGNITLTGGTNITTAGTAATITFNLDAAISLATSVTSPLYTAGAGVDVAIDAPTGQDVLMTLGDNAGTNKFSILDSDSVEVFAVDSNGGQTFSSLTVTGALTQTAGVVSIGADNAANAITLGSGTVARTITIGGSTGTHIVNIGNSSAGAITVDTAAGISLDSATASNFTVTGAADLAIASSAGGVNITSGEAATSTGITIDATAADGGVTIDGGTGGILVGVSANCSTLSLGDIAPTANRTITIGGGAVVTASVTDTIDIGPDGATTNADSVKTVNVNTGGVTTGQVLTNIATGAVTSGTHTTAIATGARAAGTMALNIFTGTGTKIANLGNADAGTTFNIDAVTLINDSVNANTSINTGTSTGTINLGNSLAGAITVGSGAALVADISANVEVNSSAGQILIGNDDVDQDMEFGTDGERTVTIGSTNGAAGLVLQAGTGNITATGTFESITSKQVINSGATITFKSSPTTCTAADTAGVATGATGDVNLLGFAQGIIMEQFIIGAGQTIIKPTMANSGLLCSLDLTNTEGVEYNFGAGRTTSEYAFTIGTDAAFFFEVTMTVADISGGAPYFIGFRKSEANNATYTTYSDYYAVGLNAVTSGTNVTAASELNGGGTTLQDTGTAWTGGDGGTVTLKVLVSAAGVVTATIDGGDPSTPLVYTFDNTDVVCPFIHIVHNADAGAIHLVDMSVGLQ